MSQTFENSNQQVVKYTLLIVSFTNKKTVKRDELDTN